MNWLAILGFVAGALSIVSFLPQLIQAYKTKNTKAISFSMYLIFCLGGLLWLTYGWLKQDWPVFYTNILIGLQSWTIFILKIKYDLIPDLRRHRKNGKSNGE